MRTEKSELCACRRCESVRADGADWKVSEGRGQVGLDGELAAPDPVTVCSHAVNRFPHVPCADQVLNIFPRATVLHLKDRLCRRESPTGTRDIHHVLITVFSLTDTVRPVLRCRRSPF